MKSNKKSGGQFHQSPQLTLQKNWLPQISLHNWTNVVKKMCQHQLWGEDSRKLTYMAELLSKNHCWESKTMSRGSSGPKTGQLSSEKKFLWTDELKFEVFGSNRRVYVQQRVNERAATPSLTPTIKHRGGSIVVWGLLFISKSGVCTRWKANWIRLTLTAYYSIMWPHLGHGLWLQDLYSCKIMIQSILVNSAIVH